MQSNQTLHKFRSGKTGGPIWYLNLDSVNSVDNYHIDNLTIHYPSYFKILHPMFDIPFPLIIGASIFKSFSQRGVNNCTT